MAEQIAKRESLRKTVQEFYALQSPKFKPDAESLMKHIHSIYGEGGHPGNGETSDTEKTRASKRGIAQTSEQPGKSAACAGNSDEALSIGEKPTLAPEGSDSGSEDTFNLRPSPKPKRVRIEQSAVWSSSSQNEESSESEGEMSKSDALDIATVGGASLPSSKTDASSNNEESSGLKPPPSKADEASEENHAGVDCGSPERRSTLSEKASTQDECIGADANSYDSDQQAAGSSDSSTSLEIWDDDDPDRDNSQEARAETGKISTSKLQMALQGLKAKSLRIAVTTTHDLHSRRKTSPDSASAATDPESVTYKGKTFYRGRCYRYREISIRTSVTKIDAIVGVLRLLPGGHADCVLIVPFCDTFLGVEEEGVDFQATYQPSAFVRVHDELPPLSLGHFIAVDVSDISSEADLPISIPTLVYEPQSADERYQFGYHWHKELSHRCGKRDNFRVLDLFAGCGGMSQGFHNNGFDTVKAVEKNPSAAESLTTNLKVPVFQGDIREFLKRSASSSGTMGRIDHIHASPPCQGFSRANRNGGKDDAANNALSMCFVQAIESFGPVTGTYENVLGLWDRKNRHYLKTLLVDLMKLGYQVRCTKLTALDYGDPQKRERLFIFAAHKAAILPGIPPKTHGNDSTLHQQPYVTAREALYGLGLEPPNSGDSNDVDGGEATAPNATTGDPQVQLQADSPACTVRASKPPMHYDQNRSLTVREVGALQSFRADFQFCCEGSNNNKASQYRQIGNAVPVEMATAVARSVRQSLLYYYRSEGGETGTVLI